ncbi:4-(cytidine 5'-diphospho)-2-C-methyl-D-erythritol kinase [Silvibacterium sp.]|uniref:4-(cytidine 5'-diphospho)-2-C-methyl-D-erythritol kinase n=1 Tax=Silvibacterium sp. TaxID=1964179 RepID=UPI0039E54D20
MSTVLRSYSKINLGLAIGPTRPDGFHGLTTCYQTLEAHDLVTVEAHPASVTAISLACNDERVPCDHRNTAWKAVERTLTAMGVTATVSIHIEKRLPVQGGMGAGSANAVAAALALEIELAKHGVAPLSGAQRLEVGAAVGSDVPLFLIGGAVLGVSRGEEVYPLPDFESTHCVVALPEIGVSTPEAFRDWDKLHLERTAALTPASSSDKLSELSKALASAMSEPHSSGVFRNAGGLAERSKHSAESVEESNPLLALVRTGIENDFEEVVFPRYPQLGQIKRVLEGSDRSVSDTTGHAAIYACLSGSGSALFGLYRTAEAAEAAVARLEAQGIRSLLTRTLPRERYWGSMRVK